MVGLKSTAAFPPLTLEPRLNRTSFGATNATEFGQNRRKINEASPYRTAHDGLVAVLSSPSRYDPRTYLTDVLTKLVDLWRLASMSSCDGLGPGCLEPWVRTRRDVVHFPEVR